MPQRDVAIIKQAAKLIDAERDYKMALQKAIRDVKDDKIKANLEKWLAKRE